MAALSLAGILDGCITSVGAVHNGLIEFGDDSGSVVRYYFLVGANRLVSVR